MSGASKGDFDAIPILDVSGSRSGSGVQSIANELRGYLENVGFLYIKGHDVPHASIEAVRAESRRFHNLPLDEKMKLKMDRNFRGYIPIEHIGEGDPHEIIPEFLKEVREAIG